MGWSFLQAEGGIHSTDTSREDAEEYNIISFTEASS